MKRKMTFILALLVLFTGLSGYMIAEGETTTEDATVAEEETEAADETEAEEETEAAEPGEKVTLTALVATGPDSPAELNDITILKDAEEALNIHIEWIGVSAGTAFDERKGIMLATNDLPDIMYSRITDAELAKYGAEGAFIPMQDLIAEHAPNLTAILEERPELKAFVTAPDGNIYGVPKVSEGPWSAVNQVYGINIAWLEALDLEMPTTLSEFEEVLVAFRDNDPNGNGEQDEIPFSFASGDQFTISKFEYIFSALGLPVGPNLLDVQDGNVVYVATDERFFEGIKIIARYYEEGLIDPEAFIMDDSQWVGKLNLEPSIMGANVSWDLSDFITSPELRADYDYMPALRSDDGADPVLVAPPAYGFFRGAGVITSACENPEVAMRYIDYWYEPINSYESMEGKIGERLFEQEDGSLQVATGDDANLIGGMEIRRLASSLGFDGIWYVDAEQYTTDLRLPSTDLKVAHINEELLPYADAEPWPPVFYTAEESESIAIMQTDVQSLINRRAAEWITAGVNDGDWEAFQEELQAAGINEVVETMQTAYDRYMSQ